jgi:hypothetical protein
VRSSRAWHADINAMPLYLSQSSARLAFKYALGNANHLIITALVGLDAIERGRIKKAPKELHAVWSPINPKVSARRSRRLLLDMALVRSVDALDVYIRYAIKKPTLIQSEGARIAIDRAKLSIFGKFKSLTAHYTAIDIVPAALVALMIAWRNRAAHAEADTDTPEEFIEVIKSNASEISSRFRGLDTGILLSGYDELRAPHFKEIASFINATQHFVEDLEFNLFATLNQDLYLRDLIWMAISPSSDDASNRTVFRKKRLQSIWGKDPSRKRSYIDRFLQHQGLSTSCPTEKKSKQEKGAKTEKKRPLPLVVFDDDLLKQLAEKSPSKVYEWINPKVSSAE